MFAERWCEPSLVEAMVRVDGSRGKGASRTSFCGSLGRVRCLGQLQYCGVQMLAALRNVRLGNNIRRIWTRGSRHLGNLFPSNIYKRKKEGKVLIDCTLQHGCQQDFFLFSFFLQERDELFSRHPRHPQIMLRKTCSWNLVRMFLVWGGVREAYAPKNRTIDLISVTKITLFCIVSIWLFTGRLFVLLLVYV